MRTGTFLNLSITEKQIELEKKNSCAGHKVLVNFRAKQNAWRNGQEEVMRYVRIVCFGSLVHS